MTHPRPLVVVHRQALFDVAQNGKDIAEFVGLPPISEEVADMERRASHDRLHRVSGLFPGVSDHAAFLAAVFVRVQQAAAEENGVEAPEGAWHAAYDAMTSMITTACMSMMSLYVDMGLVHLDPAWEQPSEEKQ